MITLNQTPLADNLLITIVQIELDGSTLYLSNAVDKITLSTIDFDGKIIHRDTNYEISKNINIVSGGGIGDVANFSFSIANFTNNYPTNAQQILRYFPNTGSIYLTNRKVKVGFVWSGATATSQITWFYTGVVNTALTTPSQIDITTIEVFELDGIQIPYYQLQKDTDNGISYTTALDEDQYGTVIPIVYGDFYTITFEKRKANLTPAVLFNKENYTFKFASHKCFLVAADNVTLGDWDLFKYIKSIDSYLQMTPDNGSYINDVTGSSTRLLSSSRVALQYVTGKLIVVPTKTGVTSDIVESSALYDYEYDGVETNLTLADTKKVCLSVNGTVSKDDVGAYQSSTGESAAGDVIIHVQWKGTVGHAGYLTIQYYSKTGSYSPNDTKISDLLATLTTSTSDIGAANFTVEDLFTYDFVLSNDGGGNGDSANILISRIWIEVKNLAVFGFTNVHVKTGTIIHIGVHG